ncbi:MAG: carboxypeptidase regulatory-like domain-containing protein [Planctomycetes bacterium]|nr:carboxypeptidase regulatory-like domain-containing protein [Planctomycetota bacterium]
MPESHSCERSKRRGAASTGLFIVIFVAAALVVATFVWLGQTRDRPAAAHSPSATSTPVVVHDSPLTVVEKPPRATTTPAPPPALGPNRYDGLGRIRGEIIAREGTVLPTDWTLVVEPSPTLVGSERAVRRRLEFHAGEREFEVGDLPLGGYQIRAEAAGLNCTPVDASLIKGSEDVFATVLLRPSGFIDGYVLASNGAPADGVPVVLEAADTQLRTRTHADANGKYLFTNVLDGNYKLYIGSPDSPLVPPGDILFIAPSLRFRELKLPPTGALVVYSRTETGAPVPRVSISGFGVPKGSLTAETGDNGIVRVPFLLPGEYRIEGLSDEMHRGRANATVTADVDTEVVVHLRAP